MRDAPTDPVPIVVASNRGPVSFRIDEDGKATPTRVSGGLATSLIASLSGTDATWIAAMPQNVPPTDDVLDLTVDGFRVVHQVIDSEKYRQYYDVMSNGTLWFLHHNLFDLARRPRIDQEWWDAWHAYCDVNESFAHAIAEIAPERSIVLVHDYHLALTGKALREMRPDLRTVHFVHTPFASAGSITTLPRTVVTRMLESMSAFNACGFHSQQWADSFALCCASTTGRTPRTFISSPTPSPGELEDVASSNAVQVARAKLRDRIGERKLIVRVDRMELSKNLLRGFEAFDDLLTRYGRWRENVDFVAQLYPSREALPEYKAYRIEVEELVAQINERWGTSSWTPIHMNVEDNFAHSVAAYLEYDVLLVNPIRDGLNLVAKEGALVNDSSGAVVLSREAGAWRELGDGAIGINPYDILGTSDALLHALEMDDEERTLRAEMLKKAARLRTPQDWLNDQLLAARR